MADTKKPGESVKRNDRGSDRAATLRSQIRQARLLEESNPEIKRAGSIVEMQKMAMRYIPEHKIKPEKTDPMHLFEHTKPDTQRWGDALQSQQNKGDLVHLFPPRVFPMGVMDSLAEIPSTIARKLSNETVRGSNLSTHLSDMPSTFSQALQEEPSMFVVATVSTQKFDISTQSIEGYKHKWLSSLMSGFIPRQTFTLGIINMITRKLVELRVSKNNTMNEVCHLYMHYENHPEYYVWKDIYGRVLSPDKTLVENGLVRREEVLEFQGYRRLPVILLYFRDGFENDPPLPLNPLHALKQREPGLCRNY